MDATLDGLLLFVPLLYVWLAPYTKVEESFNLHATHDVIMYGIGPNGLQNYDHFVFSGAVPRTFIGSVVLGWISKTPLVAGYLTGLVSDKFATQIGVRFTLAVINAFGLICLRRSVQLRFGKITSFFFTLLTLSQFHLPFWMGRTLPNMFALPFVNLAHDLLLANGPKSFRGLVAQSKDDVYAHYTYMSVLYVAIAPLTFAGIIFRGELALLLGPLVLLALLTGRISFLLAVKSTIITGLASLALTVFVDSYFWKNWPLWPELAGIYFNVVQGKSSEWGTSPGHIYFSSHLPKLLMTAFPLAIIGFAADGTIRAFTAPSIMFIGLISALAHKEWRFIIYTVPVFNVAAARGLRILYGTRKWPGLRIVTPFIVAAPLVLNVVVTAILTATSVSNYPGGVALSQLNDKFADLPHARVHISNLAAQTGASLFLQTHAPPYASLVAPQPSGPASNWTYSKTDETLSALDFDSSNFTHLILEHEAAAKEGMGWNALVGKHGKWSVVQPPIRTFDRWEIDPIWRTLITGGNIKDIIKRLRDGKWPVQMKTREVLWILERVEEKVAQSHE